MRLGLRGRILLLVLVALAPATAIAFVVAFEERDEAREHAQRDVLDTARVAAADVQRVMTGTASVLSAFSRDLAEQPGRRSCERIFGLLPRATARYSAVGAARPDGTVYCGATKAGVTRPATRVDVSRAGWFQAAQASGGFVLADLRADPLSGTRALVAARPIAREPDSPPSVVFAAI